MKKFLSILILIALTFTSCNEYAEINLGDSQLPENQPNFQVDFDNQTFVADYTEASIVNGVTILRATKTSTKEVIVIRLNKDEVGEYTFSPNDNIGTIVYKKDIDDAFHTSPSAFSGRVDLSNIDYVEMKLFGTFSFIGIRMIPLLDDQGQPVLDTNNNIVYTEEIKNFTNGLFENINFSITQSVDTNIEPEIEPTNNSFFVKIDNVEFEEDIIIAEKKFIGGAEVIEIKATDNATNHILTLQFPVDVVFGSSHLLQSTTTNPASESLATYRILSLSQEFGAYSGGAIAVPLLQIISHDTNTKKIIGTFEFSGQHGSSTKEFTEGAFSITYTE